MCQGVYRSPGGQAEGQIRATGSEVATNRGTYPIVWMQLMADYETELALQLQLIWKTKIVSVGVASSVQAGDQQGVLP